LGQRNTQVETVDELITKSVSEPIYESNDTYMEHSWSGSHDILPILCAARMQHEERMVNER